MITPTTTPRTRRLRIAVIVTATLAALAAALYAIDTRTDAISCALRIPARLDASTPARQGGFELIGIARGDKDIPVVTSSEVVHISGGSDGDTVLGIRCRWMPLNMPLDRQGFNGPIRVKGRSSLGSVFELPVNYADQHIAGDSERIREPSVIEPPIFGITIPGSYPPSYKWIDIEVVSTDGHKAAWRIIRLPRTHRAIKDPGNEPETVHTRDGVTISYSYNHKYPFQHNLQYRISHIPFHAPAGEHWEYVPDYTGCQNEWETLENTIRRRRAKSISVFGCEREITAEHPIAETTADYYNCPFPEARYYRSVGKLLRIATIDEPVAFENVPVAIEPLSIMPSNPTKPDPNVSYLLRPQSKMIATTPSGLALQLLPYPEHYTFVPGTDGVNASFILSRGMSWSSFDLAPLVDVPGSPLTRKYHKPVQIVGRPVGYTIGMYSHGSPSQANICFHGPSAALPTLKKFKLVLRQRVIVEETPMSFVVAGPSRFAAPASPKATRTP
ncbi:MAG TPA: hypothetical protein VGK19_22760 [Capsulimonadaceae bacterium]|jgi:hypothetical protein